MGSDLRQGIRINDLPDGGIVAGDIDGQPVILVRKGDEFFAVSAECTHYHGPLAEGLLAGETIHCPWHHACFSLRTGSAECAPAMRSLRVYETKRDGDVVRVGNEITPAAAQSTTSDEHTSWRNSIG